MVRGVGRLKSEEFKLFCVDNLELCVCLIESNNFGELLISPKLFLSTDSLSSASLVRPKGVDVFGRNGRIEGLEVLIHSVLR